MREGWCEGRLVSWSMGGKVGRVLMLRSPLVFCMHIFSKVFIGNL